MLRKRARADPLAAGALPRRVLGRDREKAAAPAPDHCALIEPADDLRRPAVDQARGVELLVWVVLVAPAVRKPLTESDATYLPAQLGPEAAAGHAGAGRYRAFDLAQLNLQVHLQGAGKHRGEFHVRRDCPRSRSASGYRFGSRTNGSRRSRTRSLGDLPITCLGIRLSLSTQSTGSASCCFGTSSSTAQRPDQMRRRIHPQLLRLRPTR
jgi:hypothetical protein